MSMEVWRPFTQAALDPPPVEVERAEGVHLFTKDGRRIIDAISSWWVNLHGHAHPRIAAAIARQASRLEHVIFAGFTHPGAEELASRLAGIAPRGLSRVFFSDDGSTAVEIALKIALQHWWNRGETARTRFVALEHAYHGDTSGAMSVGDDSPFTAAFDAIRFPVLRAHTPYYHSQPRGVDRTVCGPRCAEPLDQILERLGPEIAAVIVEPLLQGAGGMIVQPPSFLEEARALCRRHGVLMIADECLTGFGRTGTMFATDRPGCAPDILCLAKGLTGGFLPFAATLCTEEVYRPFHDRNRRRTFFHGHSYTGNPLGCAAALANLEIFESEPVFERIGSIEQVHAARLPAFRSHPRVADVRSIGTVAAIELDTERPGYLSEVRAFLYAFFLNRGVLLRPLGNVLYILPPYVIHPDELHYIYDVMEQAVDRLEG